MMEEDEACQVMEVIQAKKAKFRVEIRKSKQKEEFELKRLKLLQKGEGEQEQSSLQNQQQAQQNQLSYSFGMNLSSIRNNEGEDIENIEINYNQMSKEEIAVRENVSEVKDSFNNGNRKNLFLSLSSVRRLLIIASSQILRSSKNQFKYSNSSNHYQLEGKITVDFIIRDNQFLNVLLELLQMSDSGNLAVIQDECMWILINLCAQKSGECKRLIELGILKAFKILMEKSEDAGILENMFWCLGNLAGDSKEARELMFEDSSQILSAVNPFYYKIILKTPAEILNIPCDGNIEQNFAERKNSNSNKCIVIQEMSFFLCNMIQKPPMPRLTILRDILQILKELYLLNLVNIKEQIIKSMRVLLTVCDQYCEEIIRLDFIKYVSLNLALKNQELVKQSLDFLSVICEIGDEFCKKYFVSSKFQNYLEEALNNFNKSKNVKLKVISLLLRLIQSSESSYNLIAEIISQEHLLMRLLILLVMDEFSVKEQVMELLTCFVNTDMGMKKLLELDYLQIILRLASSNNPQIQFLSLVQIQCFLQYGDSIEKSDQSDNPINPVTTIFFQHNGLNVLQELQNQHDKKIYQLSASLLNNYFEK